MKSNCLPPKPSAALLRKAAALYAPLTLSRPVHEIENREHQPDDQPALQLADISNDTEVALDVDRP